MLNFRTKLYGSFCQTDVICRRLILQTFKIILKIFLEFVCNIKLNVLNLCTQSKILKP